MKDLSGGVGGGVVFNTCNEVIHVLDFNLLTHTMIIDTRLVLVTEFLTKK